jgi:hypothetical protein
LSSLLGSAKALSLLSGFAPLILLTPPSAELHKFLARMRCFFFGNSARMLTIEADTLSTCHQCAQIGKLRCVYAQGEQDQSCWNFRRCGNQLLMDADLQWAPGPEYVSKFLEEDGPVCLIGPA